MFVEVKTLKTKCTPNGGREFHDGQEIFPLRRVDNGTKVDRSRQLGRINKISRKRGGDLVTIQT